jgi:hypothetical protein
MIGLVCYWKTHLQDKQLKSHPQKNTEAEILREHIRKEGGSKGWKTAVLSEEMCVPQSQLLLPLLAAC